MLPVFTITEGNACRSWQAVVLLLQNFEEYVVLTGQILAPVDSIELTSIMKRNSNCLLLSYVLWCRQLLVLDCFSLVTWDYDC